MQYVAYHFQLDDLRAVLPEGEELLRIGRWLAQRVPSVARHEVMHGKASSELVTGEAYVVAFDAPNMPRNIRESIDEKLHKMKGYKGMKVIELGKQRGYDLVKGRIPKP